MKKTESFSALGLSQEAIDAITAKGFVEPTPIQKKVIPAMLQGTKDIIGQAKTGTGKTAAFGLAIMEHLERKNGVPQALIVVPTRELALQVCEELIR